MKTWAEFNWPRIEFNEWTLRTQGASGGSIPDLSPKKYVRDFRTDFNRNRPMNENSRLNHTICGNLNGNDITFRSVVTVC